MSHIISHIGCHIPVKYHWIPIVHCQSIEYTLFSDNPTWLASLGTNPVSNPLPGNHRGSSTLATLGEQLRLDDANAIRGASAEPNVIFSWGLFGGLTGVGKYPLFGGISMVFKHHDDFFSLLSQVVDLPQVKQINRFQYLRRMAAKLCNSSNSSDGHPTYWTSRMRHDSSRPGRVCNYCVWVGWCSNGTWSFLKVFWVPQGLDPTHVRSETVLNLLTLTGTVLAILAAITARNASAAANAGALAGRSDECIPSVAACVWGYGNHPTWWLKPRRPTSRSIVGPLAPRFLTRSWAMELIKW